MNNKLVSIGAACALALAVSGCDDGNSIIPQKITIVGTAAMGAPIFGGKVRARGANGVLSTIDYTDDDGNYSITAIGLEAPILVQVEGGLFDSNPTDLITTPTDTADNQVAMLAVPVNGIVNLTPLTTLAVQQAAGQSNLGAIYTSWETTHPTGEQLAAAAAAVRANLAAVAGPLVTGWATYNFFTAPFTANQTGVDALLDSVACGATGSSTTFAVACSGGVTYDPAISIEGFTLGGGGTGGGSVTVTNAAPTSGNGTLTVTGVTTSIDGSLTRVEATGTGFQLMVYYTTATSAVTNVSYYWGAEDPVTHLPENITFCSGTCGTTVDTGAGTVTFTAASLVNDTVLATLNGSLTGL